jgi:GT2 family glycosyltransferase
MWSAAAWLRPKWHRTPTPRPLVAERGITTVIPSRNGRELLAAQLPGIVDQSVAVPHEIAVVDNGSDDGTVGWLAARYPSVRAIVSPSPLSFARAVNRGIAAARYSHVCLLNNDMLLEPGFFDRAGARSMQSPTFSAPPPRSAFPPEFAAKRPARP